MLMSDGGGGAAVVSTTLTFDGAATTVLPNSSQITSGTYLPTNYGSKDPFSAPAPVGPYGTSLNTFNGISPNGTWQLFVVDDSVTDQGSIASGWELNITTN